MKVLIKPAGKKGKGVFAARDIKKGEIIHKVDYKGLKIVKKEDISKLSEKDQNHIDYIGEGKYVVGYSAIFLVNHCCEPNCYIRYNKMLNKDLVAIKNIKKGEEIGVDYVIDTTGKWKMKCYCGSKNCRKIINSDYFKLPKDLQKKYLKFVPKWKKKNLTKNN